MESRFRAMIASAGNLPRVENPPYTADDFLRIYPQFARGVMPDEVVDLYVDFARACVLEARYGEAWRVATGLFIAHFLTLWLQSAADSDAADVLAAAQLRGLVTSKSVDGVAVTYDYSTAIQDLDGWATWKLTVFGTQFASLAKIAGLGGIYVR